MIEVQELTKYYGDRPAIQDVSFSIQKGEVLGFLGPNGAGKTTTMRIITGYLMPSAGRAFVGGHDVEKEPLEVKRLVGYLPENPPIYLDMTVRDYLYFISEIKGVPSSQRRESVARVVERCGLVDVYDRLIGNLSRGYKQRVAIAQAIVHDPEVLILDEPTIGLDPAQVVEIRELIRELGKEHTVILSTHILPEVTMTCNRVLIINEGRLIAADTYEQLSRRLSDRRQVQILLDRPLDDESFFQDVPGVESVRAEGRELVVSVGVDTAPQPELIRRLVEKGYGILEVRSSLPSLEEIYLRLISGEKGGH